MSSKELRSRKNEFIKKFIDNLCSVFKTCEETNVSLFEFYQWLQNDKQFKAKIDFVREIVFDEIEARIFQRAFNNPNLGLKVLERWRPERWGDVNKIGRNNAKDEYEPILPKEFYFITTEQFKELANTIIEQNLTIPGAGDNQAGDEDKSE